MDQALPPSADGPEQVADEGPLYVDNLIYLPFARHVADEEDEFMRKAA